MSIPNFRHLGIDIIGQLPYYGYMSEKVYPSQTTNKYRIALDVDAILRQYHADTGVPFTRIVSDAVRHYLTQVIAVDAATATPAARRTGRRAKARKGAK